MKVTKILGAAGATFALLAGVGTTTAMATTPVGCSLLDDAVRQVVNPTDGSTLLTTDATEAAKATVRGYTQNMGTAFRASTTPNTGLVGVHRLYKAKTNDYLFTSSTREVASAQKKHGYLDQGVKFYVLPKASGCAVPVPRLLKGAQHRLAATTKDSAALTASGWKNEGVKFYVTPATATPGGGATAGDSGAGAFSFAVIPDTQSEVLKSGDERMANRSAWLAQQGVKFAAQTGDMVNWDTAAHEQYVRAKAGMGVLSQSKVPYTVAVGNHDTAATGVGGSARPGKTWELVRDTTTLNRYFSAADFGGVSGAFEPGKIDNVYASYQAGGKKFMVITLEFNARKAVIEWARGVVAAHPESNVIITTHSYLTGNNAISTSNGGYGDTSPKYVYDRLVSQYPNIKMVFSGHVGYAGKARIDTGVKGNKVYSFLTTIHEGKTNPVRMIRVDTSKGTITSKISAPYNNQRWAAYDQTITGVDFV